jgi:hypothetical protein
MADRHEADIAEWIGGRQQKGSGNQWHGQMDVVNDERLPYALAADGKSTLGKGISVTLEMWRKAVEQTFSKIPTLWLRFYKDETLRAVERDLVVLDRRDFVEILEAARNWETVRQEIGHEGVLEAEDVFKNLHRTRDEILDDSRESGRTFSGWTPGLRIEQEPHNGCDCCR